MGSNQYIIVDYLFRINAKYFPLISTSNYSHHCPQNVLQFVDEASPSCGPPQCSVVGVQCPFFWKIKSSISNSLTGSSCSTNLPAEIVRSHTDPPTGHPSHSGLLYVVRITPWVQTISFLRQINQKMGKLSSNHSVFQIQKYCYDAKRVRKILTIYIGGSLTKI